MNLSTIVPPSLLARGRSLAHELGVDEQAFERSVCIELLDALDDGVAVLGGDVYRETVDAIEPDYANWSCERLPGESAIEFARRSKEAARSYITRYNEPSDTTILYVLVIDESVRAR